MPGFAGDSSGVPTSDKTPIMNCEFVKRKMGIVEAQDSTGTLAEVTRIGNAGREELYATMYPENISPLTCTMAVFPKMFCSRTPFGFEK